jgi:hypothetical protein
VNIKYDSTVLIQNNNTTNILYFPQLGEGDNNILRIIFGELDAEQLEYYDFYVLLGDSVDQTEIWDDTSDVVLMAKNGEAISYQPQTKKIKGQIVFNKKNDDEVESGQIRLGFDIDLLEGQSVFQKFYINGEFELAVGDYRELTMGEEVSDTERSKKKKQNIYIAVIVTVFLVAIFGLR